MIIARNLCDSKFFPVCGHLCGQSRFSVRLADPVKSRKRPCCNGFWASPVLVMDEKTYAPKPPALPTALIPVIELFDPAGRILPKQARCRLRCTRRCPTPPIIAELRLSFKLFLDNQRFWRNRTFSATPVAGARKCERSADAAERSPIAETFSP